MKIDYSKVPVILIGGKKFSGKSTLAREISEKLRIIYDVSIVSYADTPKQLLTKGGIVTNEQMYGSEEQKNTLTSVHTSTVDPCIIKKNGWKEGFLTGRQVIQLFANDLCKQLLDMIWVNCAKVDIYESLHHGSSICIIDDYRFGELEKRMPFHIKTIVLDLKDPSTNTDKHVSETSLDYTNADLVLVTDKTDPNNLTFNTDLAIARIQEWYKIKC